MSEMPDSESVADSEFTSSSTAESGEGDLTDCMFPLVTTYVVLSIDPVATLASLEDPEVNAVTSSLRPKKYVGFIRNTASAHNPDADFMAYKIELLRQGPTPEMRERFITSDMCVPVLPNTAHHPLDRSPLQPTAPLPWPDCYHSSLDTAYVRVAMQHKDATAAVRLSFEEMGRQMYFQLIDQDRQRILREAYETAHPPLPAQSAERHHTDLTEELHASGNCTPHPDSHEFEGSNVPVTPTGIDDVDGEDDIQAIVAMMDEEQPSDTMPLTVMTYDLSEVDAVSDPRDFFEECRVLEQLERDHYIRSKANTAAAIEHARKVDDAAFASMSKPQPMSESVPEPVTASTAQTQFPRPPAWTGIKRTIVAINHYFDEHPFWGEPVNPPPDIVVVFRRLGAKLGKIARHCTCGMLGPVEGSCSKSEQRSEKITGLDEKMSVTNVPHASQSTDIKDRRVSSEMLAPRTEPNLKSVQSREVLTSQSVPQSQQIPSISSYFTEPQDVETRVGPSYSSGYFRTSVRSSKEGHEEETLTTPVPPQTGNKEY